ncbi:MAG: response regulator [Anaerolineae bacterium]|nr:response regulator [Anaerolineae bacterium]
MTDWVGSVLIVDDEQENARLLGALLNRAGFEVHLTADSRDALAVAQAWHPDVIVLDVDMPESDGYQVCAALKAEPSTESIPVLFLSGMHEPANRVKGFKVGGADYITRPFDPNEVIARVALHVRLAQQARQIRTLNQQATERIAQLEAEVQRRQSAEAALRLNEQQFRSVVERATDGIVLTDERGAIVLWNQGQASLTGIPATEAIGQPIWEVQWRLGPPETRNQASHDGLRTLIHNALETGSASWFRHAGVRAIQRPDGDLRLGQAWVFAIPTEQGYQLCSITRDVTAQKQVEEALRAAKLEADAANAAKSTFLATISHEFRTPLNAILGFAQLLQNQVNLTPQQQNDLEVIIESSNHLMTLVGDALQMSQIESGTLNLNLNAFELPALIRTCIEMIRLKVEEKGLGLRVDGLEALPVYVMGDEQKLRQVLVNLLNNAFKFTPYGQITVRLHFEPITLNDGRAGGQLLVEVQDSGQGIAEDEQKRIFAPFVQGEAGKHAGTGSGLGLAISRAFVQLMGGDIVLESTPGQGTTARFDVLLTLARANQVPRRRSSSAEIPRMAVRRNYRVLVVDDDYAARRLIVKQMRAAGCAVQEASNGLEALSLAQEWHPALIWMDIDMPVLDGVEATRRIKAQYPHMIIIALSAVNFESEQRALQEIGCDDILPKPVRREELLRKLAAHLDIAYVGHPVEHDPRPTPRSTDTVDLKQMTKLAPEIVAGLREACVRLDGNAALRVIGQIPDEALAAFLVRLVRQHRFDRVLALVPQPPEEGS